MATQSITPKRLIQDSLISIRPIYGSLLVFRIPSLIFSLLQFVIPKISYDVISLLYAFSISTIFYGAAVFFSYKKLNQEEVTISQSLKKASEKFLELILLNIINVFLLFSSYSLIIYPFILFPRLYFAFFLVMNNGYSTADAWKRSWQLTEGYGWQIFWNILSLLPIAWVLNFLPSLISASIFGGSVWDINRGGLSTTHAGILNKLLTITISFFIYAPLRFVYVILMFMRLLALEKRKLGSSAM